MSTRELEILGAVPVPTEEQYRTHSEALNAHIFRSYHGGYDCTCGEDFTLTRGRTTRNTLRMAEAEQETHRRREALKAVWALSVVIDIEQAIADAEDEE